MSSIQDKLPKSRLTLRYRTEISGEPEDIELPLRLLIMGDFSGDGTTKDSFEERKILNFDGSNLNDVMSKLNVKLKVTDSKDNLHEIPITHVNSFLPGNVINSISTMDEMVKAKNLLNSLLSSINNSSKFRKTLTALIEKKDELQSLKELMAPGYEGSSKLPEHVTASDNA